MSQNNGNSHVDSLFVVNYRISNNLKGGTSFRVKLIVDAESKVISGTGRITQPVNPPVNIVTQLKGDFSYMCTMENCNILIVAEGFSPFHPLIHDVPQNYKNASLRMSLTEDWKSGKASYRYFDNGVWKESGIQEVKLINDNKIPALEDLAQRVKDNMPQIANN